MSAHSYRLRHIAVLPSCDARSLYLGVRLTVLLAGAMHYAEVCRLWVSSKNLLINSLGEVRI